MAYNKAKAEREWLRWKEAEEKKLRELGVDEETIQRLHTYDWAQFNKERQYLQRQVEWSTLCGLEFLLRIWNYLSKIPNPCWIVSRIWNLLRILSKEDKLTVECRCFENCRIFYKTDLSATRHFYLFAITTGSNISKKN